MPNISLANPAIYYNDVENPTDGEALLADLNTVVSELNSKETRLTAIESGTATLSGVKTFSGGIKTDTIEEKTANAGVTLDSVRTKDGMVKVAGTPTEGGEIGYADNRLTFHNGTEVKTLTVSDDLDLLKAYINGPAPVYASAASITIPAGLIARASTGTATLEVATDITMSLAMSGEGGLDTGTEAANTWYYPYLIGKADGTVSAVFSTANEAGGGTITLPTGYTLKRQLPFAVLNDASSNIVQFYQDPITKLVIMPQVSLLAAGTSSALTAIDLSAAIPPISKLVMLESTLLGNGGSASSTLATNNSATGLTYKAGSVAAGQYNNNTLTCAVNKDAQTIWYINTNNNGQLTLVSLGWYPTEVR